jgi:Mrp family chromosome partitioning ATPase
MEIESFFSRVKARVRAGVKETVEGARKGFQEERAASAVPLAVHLHDGQLVVELSADMVSRYRLLYTRMARGVGLPKRIGLQAALRGEGVTTVALGLTAVLANDLEADICLVETNFWWPKLTPAISSQFHFGLGDVVAERRSVAETVVFTVQRNSGLLPAGNVEPGQRSALVRSRALGTAFEALGERFDYLVIDLPAVLACGDAVPLAEQCDALYWVVRRGVTPLPLIRQAMEEVEHLPVQGLILNGAHSDFPSWLSNWLGVTL